MKNTVFSLKINVVILLTKEYWDLVFVIFSSVFRNLWFIVQGQIHVCTTQKWARVFTNNFVALIFLPSLCNLPDIYWFPLVFWSKSVCSGLWFQKCMYFLGQVAGGQKKKRQMREGYCPTLLELQLHQLERKITLPWKLTALGFLCCWGHDLHRIAWEPGLEKAQKKEMRNLHTVLEVLSPSSWTRTSRVLLELSMTLHCWPLLDFSVFWDQAGVEMRSQGYGRKIKW